MIGSVCFCWGLGLWVVHSGHGQPVVAALGELVLGGD